MLAEQAQSSKKMAIGLQEACAADEACWLQVPHGAYCAKPMKAMKAHEDIVHLEMHLPG